MARKSAAEALVKLLDKSSRPTYVVDDQRIVYCNLALANWLDLERGQIIGRLVEYHSEQAEATQPEREPAAPLADLCPPPRALVGTRCDGTISCLGRNGRLVHRRAEFLPLDAQPSNLPSAIRPAEQPCAILVQLSDRDLAPDELTSGTAADPTADELHRTIRQFRRHEAAAYGLESLLGNSPAMHKARAQVAAAAASGANALILGPPGTGRGHIARAIHFHAVADSAARLVPIDCEMLTDNLLRRAIDLLHQPETDSKQRSTLILEKLDRMSRVHQSQLLSAMLQKSWAARVIATSIDGNVSREATAIRSQSPNPTAAGLDPVLVDAVSTITILVPRLVERMEDLPILAQCFVEGCNRGNKQVGSLHRESIDLLALYSWPGELDELREVIASSHRKCGTHQILPADLPRVIHHSRQAAAQSRRRPERIVLDGLLADIEKEVIVRALIQAAGNKTEAAELLGMTRPRLYRRLVQLGLVSDAPAEPDAAGPEFIEQDLPEPTT